MLWNATNQWWNSLLWYEKYDSSKPHEINVSCYDGSTIQNSSGTANFSIDTDSPSIIWGSIYTWLTTVLFAVDAVNYYPLIGTLNVTSYCEDFHSTTWESNLTYENNTFIFGRSGSGSPGPQMYSSGNFSTADAYLNGSTGYKIIVMCRDSLGNITTGNRRFYAVNYNPVSSWLNASGGLYATPPTVAYTCTDAEGEAAMSGFVYRNGTLIATNNPVTNGSTVLFSNAGLSDGVYTLDVICNDSFHNSTNATMNFTVVSLCVANLTGLNEGERYRELDQSWSFACVNGANATDCGYSVNEYSFQEFDNCSSGIITLEKGWNRLNFTINRGSVLQVDATMNVFGYSQTGSFWDYPLMLYLALAMLVMFLAGMAFSSRLAFGLFMIVGMRLAFEFLSLSIVLSIVIAGISLFIGITAIVNNKKGGMG
jgi:hypothetical protein